MHDPVLADSCPKSALDQISTRWAMLKDPVQFLMRYGPAIRKYLHALLKNSHDVEDISQDLLLRVVQNGFSGASPDRGRFRDYLKTSVRNAALMQLRRKHATQPGDFVLQALPASPETERAADQAWLSDWQSCILNKAWRALESHQKKSPGNLFYTVLRLTVDHAQDDSTTLAERTTALVGYSVRAETFRKQLSRARRKFAEFLVTEVGQTLENPTPERLEEELIEIGLMGYVHDFLPADRHARK